MSVFLRVATPADADELTSMYMRSRNELADYAPLVHADAAVHEWIAHVLIPTGNVILALDDGHIAAMAAYSTAGDVTWLDQLYVCPRYQRHGNGTALLDTVKAKTAGDLQLYTFQQNAAAAAFYERHGFVAIAHGDGSDNEEGCPDILYRWSRG
ncbi:GNAT family N-acetyltransferase [Silvimonas sp.]|uniref:GNAT family N-acetyltransferase n=1 Tax=Silvimonas sp. TaxID=2650811 RepID=UPI00283C9C4F|nr:GNAT family N-acetyltransferase [Silvimonas sp.]MDR3428189.1 GNAT family N-acetyltransferase [Silvimonas sp.]